MYFATEDTGKMFRLWSLDLSFNGSTPYELCDTEQVTLHLFPSVNNDNYIYPHRVIV